MLHRIALVGALAFFVAIASCRPPTPPPPANQPGMERIAIVGHGIAFDSKMSEIRIDLKTIQAMQSALESRLGDAVSAGVDKAFADRIKAAMAQAKSDEERVLLNGAMLSRRLERADKKVRLTYDWRNRFLIERSRSLLDRRFRGQYQLSESVLRLLREVLIRAGLIDTDYIAECRAEHVPVPPNFSMVGSTGWIRQGALTYNILSPGNPADVWTWTDPARRGACIALPRDNGGDGSVAGIICQSASTGKACIWDNMLRGDPTDRRIPAATETMVIRNLQDGRTLAEGSPCTGCHTGNNIYLMSPDDPTWAKVLRGLDGPQPTPRTFTTVVEPQTDSPGGPRFTPIAHASWVNPPLTAGCGGSCHAGPNSAVQDMWSLLSDAQRPPMPPACATGGNYRNCYGTP